MSDGCWSPRNEGVGGLGGGLYYAPGPFRTPRAWGPWPIGPARCELSWRRELRPNGVLRSWSREVVGSLYPPATACANNVTNA